MDNSYSDQVSNTWFWILGWGILKKDCASLEDALNKVSAIRQEMHDLRLSAIRDSTTYSEWFLRHGFVDVYSEESICSMLEQASCRYTDLLNAEAERRVKDVQIEDYKALVSSLMEENTLLGSINTLARIKVKTEESIKRKEDDLRTLKEATREIKDRIEQHNPPALNEEDDLTDGDE